MITRDQLLAGNELYADAALALDVASISTSPLLPPDLAVHGFRYDVRTGTVHPVG